MVGDIVPLEAKQVARAGAFMDWGLEKDLLVPFSEQHHRMQAGQTYVVLILVDQSSGRVYGSTRLAKHLDEDPIILSIGEEVKIMVASVSQDAIRVVVNGRFFATIFADEIFDRFAVGEVKKAFVKQIREDGRIAISLSPQGQKGVVSQGPSIIAMLEKSGGYLPYGDKTSPGEIRSVFGISKGTFKKAIGGLMRAGAIDIEDDGIRIRKSKEGSSRRPR
jgi:predicted RNA-binding protein (virulence factor B family)